MFSTIVAAWRQRNEAWAAAHLTPATAELFQRQWNRISRFRPLTFSLLTGILAGLGFELIMLAEQAFSPGIPMDARMIGASMLTLIDLPFMLIIGGVLGFVYYFCLREYAKLQPGATA